MIGHAYWSRALAGFLHERVVVKVRLAVPEGTVARTSTGTLTRLDAKALIVTTSEGAEIPVPYEAIESVQHPPPGEEGRA